MSIRLLFALVLGLFFTTSTQAADIVVPSGGNLQAAINTARCGDRVLLEAGAVFTGNFNLIPKPACARTDADYITITTKDPAGTPPALLTYPQKDIRITTAMAARMPRVQTPNSYPAFWVNKNAKYYRIKGLNITSVPGSNTIRLIGIGEDEPRSLGEYPHKIDIEQNWIHPPEEDGTPLTATNLRRSAENSIYLEGTSLRIRQNAMQGFVGKDSSGGNQTTSNVLMTTWANDVLIENNLMEAWTYAWIFGGGSGGITTPDGAGTVSNCTSTSCVFSKVTGLAPGVPVAVAVYNVDLGGINQPYWGTAFVKSVSGSTVTFEKPLCNSNNTGGNGNTCKPFDSANVAQIPADGNRAQWDGYQIQNVIARRNILAHRSEWATFLGSASGKGYLEYKACKNCVFDGNVLKGATGLTITARNQNGAAPWNDLDGLRITNNYFENCNNPFVGYLQDQGNMASPSQDVWYINNLCVGRFVERGSVDAYISGNFSGGNRVKVNHNTVLVSNTRGFISNAQDFIAGLEMRDNIFRGAPNQCFTTGAGVAGAPITSCWRNADVRGNILFNIDEWTNEQLNFTWGPPYTNTIVNSVAAVGFVNAPSALDASGNYRLASNSPFKGRGTDGTDPGVNYPQLVSALGFDPNEPSVVPSPTPTPVPSPSPSPTPTPAVCLELCRR